MVSSNCRIKLAGLFMSILGLTISNGFAPAAEPLVWKFKEGDVLNYQMIQNTDMTMNLGPGGKTSTSVEQTIDMKWEVESVEESGAAVVKQEISRVQMDITAPGQTKVHYDTKSDEPPQGYAAMLAPALSALTSSPFHVTMTPRGEISDVEVPESLIKALSQGPGGGMLGGLATEEGFKSMVRQNALTLPEADDLAEGHQWTTTTKIENPALGEIAIETMYRYAGPREVDGQEFEVFIPTIKTNFGGGEGPGKPTVEVKQQESTGEFLFNRSKGRLESSSIKQKMDSEITIGDNTIDQQLEQQISLQHQPASDAE